MVDPDESPGIMSPGVGANGSPAPIVAQALRQAGCFVQCDQRFGQADRVVCLEDKACLGFLDDPLQGPNIADDYGLAGQHVLK